jgi:hypothetical protein
MGLLFQTIRRLVMSGRYVIGEHAILRLDERFILEWQVVDGVERGELIAEDSTAQPNPMVEVRQTLADGTLVKVVWSHVISDDIAKLVTVHFFTR